MRPIFLGLLSSAAGSLAFLLGAHVTFPDDAALKRLRFEVEDQSRGEWAIDASDLDLHYLSGVSLDDAIIYKVKKSRLRRRAEDERPAEITPWLNADRLSARLELLPLIRGGQMIAFDADMYGGTLEGEVGQVGDEQRLFAEGRAIDLSRMPLSGDDWTANLTGLLNVDSDVVINKEEIKQSSGSFKLSVDQLKLESGEYMGITLQPMVFKEAVLGFEVANGVAKVTEGHFVSDLLEATVSGDITLNKDYKRWRVRLNVVVTFSETLDKLVRFAPGLADARDDEGNYHFMMAGTPGLAKMRPDRLGAKGDRSGGSNRGPMSDEGDIPPGPEAPTFEDDPGDGSTADERRERRLERIRKARERRKAREAERGEGGADGPEGTGPGLMRPGMGPDGMGPDGMGRVPLGRGPQQRYGDDQNPGDDPRGDEENFPPGDEEPQLPDDELDIPQDE